MKRLSMKFVELQIKEYNQSKGLKYKDKGYIYLGASYGYYQLFEIAIQGSTGVNQLTSGTLRECYNKFLSL